jgi:hypothetical protein
MSNRSILFFSPNSEHCIDIWKLLKKYSILNTLIKINIDDPENNIPPHINVLPSIFVRGEPIISGKENIIRYFNLNRNNNTNNTPSNNTPSNNNNMNTINSNNNAKSDRKELPPLGEQEVPFSNQNESMFLNSNEMGSKWSDNYSFIGNNKVQTHSFEMLEQSNNEKKKNNSSNKKTLLDKRMEQMMSERNKMSSINRT